MTVPADQHLDVKIEGEVLMISVGINRLANAIELAPDLATYDQEIGEFRYPKIIDSKMFAREVAIALERESEDGTTLVHAMLDRAACDAIENGAEGVEIP